MSDFEALLRRVWEEYGQRGDLSATLLMDIEKALGEDKKPNQVEDKQRLKIRRRWRQK